MSWQFKGMLPDKDSVNAELDSYIYFRGVTHNSGITELTDAEIYASAFNRGMRFMYDRILEGDDVSKLIVSVQESKPKIYKRRKR